MADEIYRLRELKQKLIRSKFGASRKRQRIADIVAFLNEQSGVLQEYDDQLVRRLIEKVTVKGSKLTFEFKSGIETVVNI